MTEKTDFTSLARLCAAVLGISDDRIQDIRVVRDPGGNVATGYEVAVRTPAPSLQASPLDVLRASHGAQA
ncbi:MAG TPA: hypothetical protein VLA04_06785 [Verrucomicrobiae bacterium]|nr:hypothetical protein [Verrucomicrobiae bacterium]